MAQTEDRRRITVRLTILQVGVVVTFAALAIGFWFLQIVQHSRFEEMAENNHQRTLALRAPRGVLFDRDGKVLVENRFSFNISIVREHTSDLDRTIRLLAAVAGVDIAQVQQIVDRHRGEPTYRPIVVIEDASLRRLRPLPARRLDFELPYVVSGSATRQYRGGAVRARVRIRRRANDTQVGDGIRPAPSSSRRRARLQQLLIGEDGTKRVVVNSVGRQILRSRK